jgi:adenosylmethionine-8-amino-7-oxononanoate aminotransferase
MTFEIERAILREGPDSVAAVYLEPVQNSGRATGYPAGAPASRPG